ncbi:OmpW/AlkL family protein [Microbulbifer thermotolerans]|nr:OmpW family outer membrane protein [Microbulbifer thermotolerans]MCX2780817.1 outer membrane beta-barrel protein [Microbulbifer thermotolerans]MCX2784124.1 outer membrane beta-barrel protein [Microbulbifer thermotolerans]MCX2794415.1 outer membrane beta-barrel protein [Microbulbifer thermotolerans]MCX2804782.1 outer membrane beta-barrel protein [Microbulbifer thermotolerans]MCX2831613.1 outer membrane beta-barrel protein [Microbulbifer thermotolerans]
MKLLVALAAAALSVPAMAYESGTFILRTGIATVSPDVDSDALALSGTELTGTAADVDDASALGLTGVYMLNDHWGVELVAATPFTHDLEVKGLGATFDLGETKHLPPTVLLQWYPMDANSNIQPYVGLGLNYTVFFDEEIDSQANEVFAGLGATGNADLSLDNSFGMAAEAGVDFAFGQDQRWLFNLSVWWMDIDTEAEVKVPGVGTIKADVELDPLVYMAGLGYRF